MSFELNLLRAATALLIVSGVGCDSGIDGPQVGGASVGGVCTGTIDTETFEAYEVAARVFEVGSTTRAQVVCVRGSTGFPGSFTLSLELDAFEGVGSYPLGGSANATYRFWDTNREGAGNLSSADTLVSGGLGGEVRVVEVTADSVRGAFSFAVRDTLLSSTVQMDGVFHAALDPSRF